MPSHGTVCSASVLLCLPVLSAALIISQGPKSTLKHIACSFIQLKADIKPVPFKPDADKQIAASDEKAVDRSSKDNGKSSWPQLEVYVKRNATKCADGRNCELELFGSASEPDTPKKFGQELPWDILMCVLAFFVAGISLAAGVGGGGLFVPLLMMVLGLDSRRATALSQAMLMGGALSAFGYNIQASHPSKPERPLINFELACLMGSALVTGAQVGGVVHAFAPPALILILLCIVLIDAARKGVNNAFKVQAKEKEAEARQPAEKALGSDSSEVFDEGCEQVLQNSHVARWKLLLVWLLCMGLVMSKGLLVKMCSPAWWVLNAGATLILGGCAYNFASQFSNQEPVDEDDLDFRELSFPLMRMSLFAGALASLCGIGGGMVMGPILVEMKVPPPVSSATTATTLVVLSSSTAMVYLCRGVAPLDYILILSCCTLVGAFVGKLVVGWWVQRTGKQSLIVWILVMVTVLATLLMGYEGILRTVDQGWNTFKPINSCPLGQDIPGEEYLGVE